MQRKMIIAGLVARPVRTLVTILAVTLEVVMILMMIGLTTGITKDAATRTEGVGAELLVEPPGSSAIIALSTNSMPLQIGDKLRGLPGVKFVAPVMLQFNVKGGVEIFYGIDEHFAELTGGFHWREGRIYQAPYEAVVDDLWAANKKAKVGDTAEMLAHQFKIAGIVEHGQGSRVFMSMADMSDLTGLTPPKAALFYVKLNDPSQQEMVKEEMDQLLPGYTIIYARDMATLLSSSNLPGLAVFISAVIFVALCVGVLVIFLSMYTTITERTREIGILRSLGASKAFIVGSIFQETTVLCIFGVIAGIVATLVIQRILHEISPTLIIIIPVEWKFKASVFAILSGVIGSFYPSLKAASQDPVEALAYE
jgi:putative ABC transport system permease protein